MPISPGPIVPNIVDRPATFEAEAEAWTDWLANDHRTQLNELEANVNAKEASTAANATAAASRAAAAQGSATIATNQATAAAASAASALAAPATSATSATSLTPGLGAKAFVTQSGKAFAAGQSLVARSASEPRQWMVGVVTSYAGTALAISVTMFGQAPTVGPSADWAITFWGAVPAAAKPGQVLRLVGSTPEWGDEGGEAVQIMSAENLVRDSRYAGGAYWNGGILAVNDVGIAPDGTKTADRIAGNRSQGIALPEDGLYTYSRYYRQDADTYVIHRLFDSAGTAYWDVVLDFVTGSLSVGASNASLRVSDVAVGAQRVGGDWWRVWITAPCTDSLYIASDSAVGSLTWGAQLRRGRWPGLYVPTATAAIAGAGPRKRNLLAYAKQPDSLLGWLTLNLNRIGKALSPAGDLTAVIYETTVGGNNFVAQRVELAADTQYTLSWWFRRISAANNPAQLPTVFVDQGAGGVYLYRDILSTPTEWTRYVYTFTNKAPILGTMYPFSNAPLGLRFAIWGVQLETGPIASNLIDTGGAPADGQHVDLESRRVHLVDTTHAAIDIAPPEAMQAGDWFDVVDVGKRASVNPITVLLGGVGRIDGAAEPFVIDLDGWSGRFTHDPEKGLVIS